MFFGVSRRHRILYLVLGLLRYRTFTAIELHISV